MVSVMNGIVTDGSDTTVDIKDRLAVEESKDALGLMNLRATNGPGHDAELCPPHHFIVPTGAKVFRGRCMKCGEYQRYDVLLKRRVIVYKLVTVVIGNKEKTFKVRPWLTGNDLLKNMHKTDADIIFSGNVINTGDNLFDLVKSGDRIEVKPPARPKPEPPTTTGGAQCAATLDNPVRAEDAGKDSGVPLRGKRIFVHADADMHEVTIHGDTALADIVARVGLVQGSALIHLGNGMWPSSFRRTGDKLYYWVGQGATLVAVEP